MDRHGGNMPFNPATAVRGPKHVVKRGKTPVLAPEEARQLLDSIDLGSHAGLRDRALIGLMVYTFARVGAAIAITHDNGGIFARLRSFAANIFRSNNVRNMSNGRYRIAIGGVDAMLSLRVM